jgi:HD-like signal output (HDOD) protein
VHVLFVDDEPRILQGLRRMLRPLRKEWEMAFAGSGAEALELVEQQRFDVVVSDMRMPGMDGAQLLSHVRDRSPDTVRIVLSGHSDLEMVLRAVGPSHRYLTKPCDAEALKAAVASALDLRELLRSESIRALVGSMTQVPSLPQAYQELLQLLEQPDCSLQDIGALVARDIGMTSQILRLVNSAYFGLHTEVTSPERAVSFLGLGTLTSLVLGTKLFCALEGPELAELGLQRLWQRSLAAALGARAIASEEGLSGRESEDCFAAGMLHGLGALVLARNLPERLRRVRAALAETGRPSHELEEEEFGVCQGRIGGYLLGVWGLPDPVMEAVAYHQTPSAATRTGFSPLAALHVAAAWVTDPESKDLGSVRLDREWAAASGLADKLERWAEICAESGDGDDDAEDVETLEAAVVEASD